MSLHEELVVASKTAVLTVVEACPTTISALASLQADMADRSEVRVARLPVIRTGSRRGPVLRIARRIVMKSVVLRPPVPFTAGVAAVWQVESLYQVNVTDFVGGPIVPVIVAVASRLGMSRPPSRRLGSPEQLMRGRSQTPTAARNERPRPINPADATAIARRARIERPRRVSFPLMSAASRRPFLAGPVQYP